MDETLLLLLLLITFMQGIYPEQTMFIRYVRSLLHSSLAGSQNSASPTDQAIFIHCYGKNFLIIQVLVLSALPEC
jgi:hypothetical protein